MSQSELGKYPSQLTIAEMAEVNAARRAFVQLLREGVQEKAHASGADLSGAWRTLAWRDAFSTERYFEATVGGAPLHIQQQLQGELQGFGTGLTVRALLVLTTP